VEVGQHKEKFKLGWQIDSEKEFGMKNLSKLRQLFQFPHAAVNGQGSCAVGGIMLGLQHDNG
jgi:hypothetical protein